MEPSKEAIAVRITRLNRQILGKPTGINSKLKRTIDRESLLDALTVLYDECNDDPVKKCDELVKAFVDKYRSTLAELRRVRVCLSDFEIVQTIGRGHFGEVHMVREKHTSDVYALKVVRKEQAARRAAGAAEDERDVLATATAAWMPRLHYAFQDATSLYLVMELCPGGDLAGLLSRRNHPLSEADAAFYVAEVAHALKALHGMGYVHRDVKPGNILLDRCGHVKLGDFGSCARLSDRAGPAPVGTADYVAPEQLAAAQCARRHAVCARACLGLSVQTAISACDYWSLGVVAFELVTLRRPFSSGDDDSIAMILGNIQKYEREVNSKPPFDPMPNGPSDTWRGLVAGLLTVQPDKRYNYLDTLQHPALSHLPSHSIRDQAPPWVPHTRGPEDASLFQAAPRAAPPAPAAPFRARPPFAGQLPFVGYSYVRDELDDSGGFDASHDCTAIDLATYKSAEKLAAMRGREIASLQARLAAAEAGAGAAADVARRTAQDEAERVRARLQADITALSLQNKRLERQVEVEKEERMALERANQQLSASLVDRNHAELRAAQAKAAEMQADRHALRETVRQLEARAQELQAECARATADANSAHQQQKHYKDTIAKERALRRQTLSGGEAESREAGARLAQAEAALADERRQRAVLEQRLREARDQRRQLQIELEGAQEGLGERTRFAETSSDQLREAHTQLAQEKARVAALLTQVQELERSVEEASRREAALEEQCSRTEARFNQRLEVAETRASAALQDDTRHREKVNTLEQLVRQLEREVNALETRACATCSRGETGGGGGGGGGDAHSDTESVDQQLAHTQAAVLREQLQRAEGQLQARADEIASLRQEARTANLARWRKEREYNELSVEAKSTAREVKRLEERLNIATEARKEAEKKSKELQSELTALKPQHETASKELERVKQQLEKLKKTHETAQAEVDRSRNDIRKLKSELQYSEKRRMHAEEQEELSSRERSQLRDELTELRGHNQELVQNNKALQEACSLLEDQLTDLEKLADMHEVKNKDLETEVVRMRGEVETCRRRLAAAERAAAERGAAAGEAARQHDDARDRARHAHCQLQLLTERLENREARVAELEMRNASLEGERSAADAALASAGRRVRELQEECAALRTRAHQHHAAALQLQAGLAEAQEEIAAVREASEAANAWWRTRETKADSTLRQQAKLIDFLQAKVEEAGRKKCSLSNKLFGRSGRRAATSPPLRRANRELREEVDRLRAKLSVHSLNGDAGCPPTPVREKSSRLSGKKLIDTPDSSAHENTVVLVRPDGSRERVRAKCSDGEMVLHRGEQETRARLLDTEPAHVPQNEASRAFSVLLDKGGEAAVVCASVSERAHWVSALSLAPAPTPGYAPATLAHLPTRPVAALHVAPNAIAIGSEDGLHSLRGPVAVEFDCEVSPPRHAESPAITGIAAVAGRALIICSSMLVHGGLLALGSALRRASNLKPTVGVTNVQLPDGTPPHLVKALQGELGAAGGPCAALACGRRVMLLRHDAAAGSLRLHRALTVDRPPPALLLTPRALYVAGDKPLKVNMPSGALETFAMDEPTVAAAAKKHSAPKAILLIKDDPTEILLCYAECGIFVDENGKRTRNEDAKWSSAVKDWEYVNPFLYLVGDEKVTIIYITEEAYKAPPCTCDATSLASTASECYMPEKFNFKVDDPALLGTAPNGIIIRSKLDNGYAVSIIEGKTAFKSIGASIESLSTIDSKRSSTDSAQSMQPYVTMTADRRQSNNDEAPHDVSHISEESVEATTGFLADIRKRARQLRKKNRKERSPEDVIKEILTTEVGLKRPSTGRKSPARISGCESDSESDIEQNGSESSNTKGTAEVCAEMFSRQVRFQPVTFTE